MFRADELLGVRVLVVDDNPSAREILSTMAKSFGLEIDVAKDGVEALAMTAAAERKEIPYDLALMDWKMPVMDGYEATREIRKNPATRELPIVAMTANAMAGDREKVIEAGMFDHIAKPFDVNEMFATLAKWIKPAGGSAARPLATASNGNGARPSGLPPLPGIDVKAGLATTMDNDKLYLRLLSKFRESNAGFAEAFRQAQTGGDASAPARAAHTLKGTAGNIGAKGVQSSAGELEQACLSGASPEKVDALLAKTLAELGPVMEGLKGVGVAAADANGAAPTPGNTDSDRLGPLMERLGKLLADSDTEAGEVADELTEAVRGTPLAAGLKKLSDAVAQFDFDTALEALRKLTRG
jgi:CheY-like chemotaxis protein